MSANKKEIDSPIDIAQSEFIDSLRWYNESQGVKAEIKASHFDPILALTEIMDLLSHLEKDVCICALEKDCHCLILSNSSKGNTKGNSKGNTKENTKEIVELKKGQECACVNDDYANVSKSELAIMSNCQCLCEFTLPQQVPFSSRTSLRIFTLDKNSDEERPILDITNIRKTPQLLFYSTPPLRFETTEYFRRDKIIHFKFNYMSYDENV